VYTSPVLEAGLDSQSKLPGEQKLPSASQQEPLVTLCPLPIQVQRTVSPAEMRTVGGEKKLLPTLTSTI
jgi:hypothetical protein